jgi:hypothetical protein
MSESDNPFPESPVAPQMMDGGKQIQFRCRKGIACWNKCCSNIDISLTPYDILRLKKRLGLTSTEFLAQFTVPYEMEKDGIAGVKLKPVEGGSACQFMVDAGCDVYSDRPTACRYYPVALLSMRKQGESTDTDSYALVKEPHCLGHDEPRPITIDDYRKEQGVDVYDEIARGWRQLVLKKKSSGPTIGKPSKRSLQLFFMACYDVDRFAEFVRSDSFNDLFELTEEEKAKIHADDEQMMLFGFRFLRQVLFGEDSIPLRRESAEQRANRLKERQRQLEREAAERLMRDEDGMYDGMD